MNRELQVTEEALISEVAWLAKMPTGAMPATNVIEFRALLGALALRRTSYEQWQEAVIPVKGAAQAIILVDAAKLQLALKQVSGPLTITIGDDQLTIKSAVRTVRLQRADVEFPKWPAFEAKGQPNTIGAPQMARALTSVGVDEQFPMLMRVQFEGGAMISTDRFRLSKINYADKGFTASVPASVVRALAKKSGVVTGVLGTCEGIRGEWIEMTAGGRTVWAALPEDGEYPKWQNLIPADPLVRVAVHRDELLAAAGGEEVTLTLDSGDGSADEDVTLTVVSNSDGMEIEQGVRVDSVLRYDVEGPITVPLRSKYVNDCLRNVGSGLVLLDITAANKPVMMRDISENDLHLIMPVRRPA
jgi:DNA polymerase III sliding clamp (beta) subunit (PCNA family)